MNERITPAAILACKREGRRIVSLTAYDHFTARILDEAGVDVVLVGDSAATVVYGEETTLAADMPMMLYHVRAAAKSVKRALVVADMPFLSYQPSGEVAVRSAGEFLRAGAGAVKLEGGSEVEASTVRRLVEIGVPVMGHIGLQPQSVRAYGGYPLRGKGDEEARRLIEEAKRLEGAGCFSIVLEKVHRRAARAITQAVGIPTIGIGSGPDCDGQVLVVQDMLGYGDVKFKFVREYAQLRVAVRDAVERFADDVRAGRFPSDEESFGKPERAG